MLIALTVAKYTYCSYSSEPVVMRPDYLTNTAEIAPPNLTGLVRRWSR